MTTSSTAVRCTQPAAADNADNNNDDDASIR